MTEIARMYGCSLLDLAAGEGLDEVILNQLEEVSRLFSQNPDYVILLCTPDISKKDRCSLLDEAFFGSVHIYVLNFLKLLCERGYMRLLGECLTAYRSGYNTAHGIIEVKVTSAVALNHGQSAALKQKLESLLNKKVNLRYKIDAGVIGGIRLDAGGTELDGTIMNHLKNLRSSITAVS